MSQQESEGSYVVPGADPWDRVRHFTDGRDPVKEWQCSDCHTWYADHASGVTKSWEIRKGVWSQPFCGTCRPPKSPFFSGGPVIIGYGGFTEWIKQNAAERRAKGLQGGGNE
ncbi:MAG: hypothetical protein RI891_1664 [Gemmatimonadota bacterium]